MSAPEIKYCPGTLSSGHATYSRTCLNRLFNGRKVHHLLPYNSPATDEATDELFDENRKRISISGVQEKFSVLLDKNKIRLVQEGEQGTHILKPIPYAGKKSNQMPANEHLTMQIARQVFGIETAENGLIFFQNGIPAYLTKRFDVKEESGRWAKEDFASLAGKTPQTHGDHYKYSGNYLELFELMKKLLPTYQIEAPKLFRLLVFNYLFSNGDAHLKNFSVLETPLGDFRLSPAYDLLNTRIHIDDSDFALEEGLIPRKMTKGTVPEQFRTLAGLAGINTQQVKAIFHSLLSGTSRVEALLQASFLNESAKRSYLQAYQHRYKKLSP